jgi:excisionase family DNA binding protein
MNETEETERSQQSKEHRATLCLTQPDNWTPWGDVNTAAARARVGVKTVYRAVRTGRLKAVRVNGRRELRFRAEWVDQWLDQGDRR